VSTTKRKENVGLWSFISETIQIEVHKLKTFFSGSGPSFFMSDFLEIDLVQHLQFKN